MTIEPSEHGTRSTTEHRTSADVVLRSAAFVEQRNATGPIPSGTRNTEHGTERTVATERNDSMLHGTDRPTERPAPSRWRFLSGTKPSAEQLALAQQQRNAAVAAERSAAERAAAALRRSARTTRTERRTAEQTAPVPAWMLWVGAWFDRTLGALPLIAPLLVSAFFTTRVMSDQPVNAPLPIAIIMTLALEGGVWKLAKLLERTLLEGDSTISLRMGIAAYLGLISGGIFGHAYYKAYTESGHAAGVQLKVGDWLPAAATAAMSVLGVYIWSRQARFQHRVELRRMGLIDTQAPKFSLLSWVFCPIETPKAFRHAIKFRITSPLVAVRDRRFWVAAGKPKVWNVDLDETEHAPEESAVQQNAPSRSAQNTGTRTAPHGQRTTERNTQERNTTRNATEHGTTERSVLQNLEEELTGESAPAERSTDVQRNASPGERNGHTGNEADTTGTRNAAERSAQRNTGSGTQDSATGETLRLATYLLDVAAELPDWNTVMPSVRAVRDAIAAARVRRGEPAFKSMGIAADVARELRRLSGDPAGAAQIDQLRNPNN